MAKTSQGSGLAFGSRIIATTTLQGLSAYSQSRAHEDPAYENEDKGDYDRRTWRSKLHINPQNNHVVIPAKAITDVLAEACQYSGRKIPGQGQKTWTAKFEAGIALLEDPDLGITADEVTYADFYCHINGKRGSSGRVMRRFPMILNWQTTFAIHILDPQIVEPVLREMFAIAGTFRGIGRYRPASRGTNGRFQLANLSWQEHRQFVQAA
jgi:hypothetical protein